MLGDLVGTLSLIRGCLELEPRHRIGIVKVLSRPTIREVAMLSGGLSSIRE